jgi:hypothetical protein
MKNLLTLLVIPSALFAGPIIDNAVLTTPTVKGAVAFEDGTRQTFNPDGTNSGLNVGSHSADPSSPSNGDFWYNTSLNAMRARINGATVSLGAGAGDVTAAGDNAFTGTNTMTGVELPLAITTSDVANKNSQFSVASGGVNITSNNTATNAYGSFAVGGDGPIFGLLACSDGTNSASLAVTGTDFTFSTQGTNAVNMVLGGGTAAGACAFRFLEPSGSGSNYSEFKPQAQAANITYVLPSSIGTSGQVLGGTVSGTTKTLEWVTPSSVIDLGVSMGSDDTYTGTIRSGLNNSGGVTQWDAVYLNGSSQWVIADANGSGTYPARGLAVATVATGNATTIITRGTVRNDAWNWTPGGTIFLSTTAGGLTQTAPSTTGDKVQVMGYALDADTMAVEPSSDYGTAP